ncbi:MAG: alpha/beta fold hydrolase [Deltaproteobacteria bacterium]|nr:alpha/beta fold hydrolase [Deltaproteobacteria bacterium]
MDKARTVAEVKDDIRSRVGHRAPFLHADNAEAEEALAQINTFEGEAWAVAWNALGARWEDRANAAEKAGDRAQAKEAYLKSYGYYGIARHPFPSTPGKRHGYAKTREMFLAASKYFDIPVERVSIPFQDKAIVGHLRLPKKLPAPMIMHWGGIDNWKEERHSFAESFVKEGWGCFVMDSPGTGECSVLAGPDAHQVHTAALDYLLKRPEVDADKIAVVGASFGGHWSTKLAHLAPDRLRAAVNWGGGIHHFFSAPVAGAVAPRRLVSLRFDRSARQPLRQENLRRIVRRDACVVAARPRLARQTLRAVADRQRQRRQAGAAGRLLSAA